MDSTRKEHLVADIAARLRRVCPHMPDDDFAAMVDDMARVAQKNEGSASPFPLESISARLPKRGREAPPVGERRNRDC